VTSDEDLTVVILSFHVPKALTDELSLKDWVAAVTAGLDGEVSSETDETLVYVAKKNIEEDLFPLKMKDQAINQSCVLLREKNLTSDQSGGGPAAMTTPTQTLQPTNTCPPSPTTPHQQLLTCTHHHPPHPPQTHPASQNPPTRPTPHALQHPLPSLTNLLQPTPQIRALDPHPAAHQVGTDHGVASAVIRLLRPASCWSLLACLLHCWLAPVPRS
jgi:hypothetical protein